MWSTDKDESGMEPELLQEDVEGSLTPRVVVSEYRSLSLTSAHPPALQRPLLPSSGLGSGLGFPVDSKRF